MSDIGARCSALEASICKHLPQRARSDVLRCGWVGANDGPAGEVRNRTVPVARL